jgi:hypothetical protein
LRSHSSTAGLRRLKRKEKNQCSVELANRRAVVVKVPLDADVYVLIFIRALAISALGLLSFPPPALALDLPQALPLLLLLEPPHFVHVAVLVFKVVVDLSLHFVHGGLCWFVDACVCTGANVFVLCVLPWVRCQAAETKAEMRAGGFWPKVLQPSPALRPTPSLQPTEPFGPEVSLKQSLNDWDIYSAAPIWAGGDGDGEHGDVGVGRATHPGTSRPEARAQVPPMRI